MTTDGQQDSAPVSAEEQAEIMQLYEERADHLELQVFKHNTVLAAGSEEWVQALTGTGAKLLVGPRGCGKTHLMRFAFSECIENENHPFAIYVNLNRYYRLEPLLRRRPDAIAMFYTWVVANVLVGLADALKEFASVAQRDLDIEALLEFDPLEARDLIGALEQSRSLDHEQDVLAAKFTIDRTKNLIFRATEALGRRRAVLFLDDAALTLAPEYLTHFFDIYRALKAARIAPKASVYPGTTEYGASFHVAHEADRVFVWKSVTDGNYQPFMQDIAAKRFPDAAQVPEDVRALLAYAAFGVPRSFMALVRSFNKGRQASPSATPQSLFNTVIEDFCGEKMKEYRSLKAKTPQLATILEAGATCFTHVVASVAEASQNLADEGTRQIFIGITSDGIGNTYVERMLLLLQEVGMIYRYSTVSHGDRDYVRFVPHLAALIDRRAFSRRGAFSPRLAVEILQRPDEKHPVRRSISTLLDSALLQGLGLDLPNCVNCGTRRVEGAKYCFYCGAKLTEESTYDRLLQTRLSDVPGLTSYQKKKLAESPDVPKTVGEFLALQDRGTPLRTIRFIGSKRAKTVIDTVEAFLDEFLS
ncbi:zinc-ribbon domain-containing protein [Rhizobacter sp. SG703]|uniref:zinc ribbon domain-containing protein n=1 Tax=Rhizobacter sp. SG703 TaxID=2587140 RepID=UPI0014470C72|nr:zinc-ribbon domain-containing protein [Rhizobacter sp. SG703]NKI92735.1 hypothetical protein [Rhizobacter sp. SG703]